jgi:ECF transporter S component (folate family)
MQKTKELSVFSLAYWREAAAQFANLRMVCVAAMFIALRVILKLCTVSITNSVHVEIDFLADALGSALFGPLMGLACGAITDTINAVCFPVGPYFMPFILQEMLGSFLFGLFFWRRKLTVSRILVAKCADTVLCNMILNSLLLMWLYGGNFAFMTLPRFVKNISFYPVECFCLTILFTAVLPGLSRLPIGTNLRAAGLKMTKRHYLVLGILLGVAVAVTVLFCIYGLPLFVKK